ncbi:MAG: DMT family transporter [Candidatus Dadabacteria bacterium]|nr:DMT family transporter [Candidatus Dadabacteria bacterium]
MSAGAVKKTSAKFPLAGYLFLVGTALFTALSYVFGRAIDRSYDPFLITFFWFGGAFVCSIFVVMAIPSQRAELKHLPKYTKIFIYTSVLTAIGAALWISSIKTIGIPLTSFLMKAQTLFSLLLGMIFLGERLNKGETVGIVITIAGGVVVAYQRDFTLLMGTLTALGAAFFYSCLSFSVKKVGQELNMLTVANMRALGVAICLLLYILATGTYRTPGPVDIAFMALGGITGAYIAKACQFQAIKMIDVSRTTAVLPLESLFVVLLSYFIFHEIPSVIKLLGGAAIITGVIFLVIFRGKKPDDLGEGE